MLSNLEVIKIHDANNCLDFDTNANYSCNQLDKFHYKLLKWPHRLR